jgi:hypothetical protein
LHKPIAVKMTSESLRHFATLSSGRVYKGQGGALTVPPNNR